MISRSMARNYYVILGVAETATPAEVQDAFRRLAKVYHPDVSGGDTSSLFREVQEAWDTLRDKERRRQYDEQIRRQRQPLRPAGSFPSAQADMGSPSFKTWPDWGRGPLLSELDSVLHLQLRMSRAEAAQGGRIPMDLPALTRCPGCGGSGRRFLFPCPACGGTGRGLSNQHFLLNIPPGLAHGALFPIPLNGGRLLYRHLIIHVSIDETSFGP